MRKRSRPGKRRERCLYHEMIHVEADAGVDWIGANDTPELPLQEGNGTCAPQPRRDQLPG